MWSEELIELSKEYLEYEGTHVKHHSGKFGILNIQDNVYTIQIKPELTEALTFNSVKEIIKSGWAVD